MCQSKVGTTVNLIYLFILELAGENIYIFGKPSRPSPVRHGFGQYISQQLWQMEIWVHVHFRVMEVFWPCFQTHLILWSWTFRPCSKVHYRWPCNLCLWDVDQAYMWSGIYTLLHQGFYLRKICSIRTVPSRLINRKMFSMKKSDLWLSWEMMFSKVS